MKHPVMKHNMRNKFFLLGMYNGNTIYGADKGFPTRQAAEAYMSAELHDRVGADIAVVEVVSTFRVEGRLKRMGVKKSVN
jgi:hypothetical protein